MIRLTLNAQSDPEIHLFNKSPILMGANHNHVDLILPGSHIQPLHLKIIEEKGCYLLTNTANDPFASLNGHPFGKKSLNSGDIIALEQATLLFEILESSPQSCNSENKEQDSGHLSESKINKETDPTPPAPSLNENILLTPFDLPFEKEVEALNEQELQAPHFKKYLNEIESKLEEIKETAYPANKEKNEPRKTSSLKDDYLKDLDDDNHREENISQGESSHLYQAWKWILIFIFSLLFITGGVGTIIYFTLSDKTEAQETKAAQGVADVAMALIHAQLNNLKPHNHNWSDVDFLKSNLQAILPDNPSYASQIDAQGQFNSCPYSLRIYTSSDLSHFLLIAQPAPNLLNWLVPQSLIVVDSHLMELHILKDVRGLNRLLANQDPLEGLNGKEISSLIKTGGLIHLATLANDSGHHDFSPPKILAWIRPGAEDLIYNAPRYHRLGHNIIQKSMSLATTKGSSQEVTALKQDIENISSLTNFVLYSDQGKKSATLIRQGLTLFAPSDKLLYGYLLFNAQGKIHQVYLLKDEEEIKESSLASESKEEELVALQNPSEITTQTDISKNNSENSAVEKNHPIYIQLQSLIVIRENALKPLATTLNNFINQELKNPSAHFQVEFQNLSHHYLMENAKHKQAIKETLDQLYHQYDNIPIHQFWGFVKALNLEQLIQHDDHSLSIIDENCQQNMELLLTYIENSKSLVELDNLINIASSWLNFDYIKDPNELMKYQNLLRNHLLEQFERYLLSQKKHSFIKPDDREVLLQILNQERLIKPEEKDFFLEEFDQIFADPPS